jgi:hypothetical protein
LKQTLESIEENKEAHDIHWYFFQDGPPDANTKRCVEIFKNSKLKNTLKINQQNQGIAWQKFRSHELFENHDYVMFFEDDMIVSPDYIKILYIMSKQYPDAMVTACDRTIRVYKQTPKNIERIVPLKVHLWGYMVPSQYGKQIKDLFHDFCLSCGPTYKGRPHQKLINKFGMSSSSHDSFVGKALDDTGIRRITTLIPRARYIGRIGMHATPQNFDKKGYSKQREFIFESDKTRESFEYFEHWGKIKDDLLMIQATQ